MTIIAHYYTNNREQMHPADIKASLNKVGSSMRKVAVAMAVTESTVSHVVYGRSSSRRIAKEISRLTGLTLEQMWPGRYSQEAA